MKSTSRSSWAARSRRGELSEDKRNALLATLTDDVAAHVLADNYNQTLALSVAEQPRATSDIDAHGRLMRDLEARGKLDRARGIPAVRCRADQPGA